LAVARANVNNARCADGPGKEEFCWVVDDGTQFHVLALDPCA